MHPQAGDAARAPLQTGAAAHAQAVTPTDPALALLHDVAVALLAAPPEVEPILAEITSLTVPRLADLAIIYLLREDRTLERLAIVHHMPAKAALVHELQRRYPPNLDAPIGLAAVLRSGRPELIADAQASFGRLMADDEQHALVAALAPRSYLTVPLQADGAILGALQLVVTESDRQYTVNDLVIAEAISSRCALALRNARHHAQAQATAERTARLGKLVEALNAATTPEAVARTVAEHTALALGAHTVSLALYSENRRTLSIAHAVGYPPELVAAWRTFSHDAPLPLADAARTGEPLWLPNLQARQERYPHLAAPQAATGTGALACLPLIVDREVIGVLGVGLGVDRTLDDELQAFLQTLAHQSALALERARLYEAERDSRRRAEAALSQRDRFLTAAAHELRTPLTALLGNAQLLRRRTAGNTERQARERKMLDTMVGQALRLSALISNLLTVAELDTGELELARGPIDLCKLARRVLAELAPFADQHQLICEAPDEGLLVPGDAVRLHAVLEALLRNALVYSPGGDVVIVRVREVEEEIELSVSDQGQGVPAEELERIFERYYRAPNAEAALSGGLGINLWLAREVVRRHGGDIAVESAVGSGSTFVIRLPRWQSDSELA